MSCGSFTFFGSKPVTRTRNEVNDSAPWDRVMRRKPSFLSGRNPPIRRGLLVSYPSMPAAYHQDL